MRIAVEPFSESNTASDKDIWETNTKYGLADVITNNRVAVKNGDVVMPKKRENLKRIRKEVGELDFVDITDEAKMKFVDEEMEGRPHKKQKLVSCL